MRRLLVIGVAIASVAALSATASSAPAVPLRVQQAIEKRVSGQVAYVPTRLPAGYRYAKWHGVRSGLDIWFGPGPNPAPLLGFHASQSTPCSSYGHPIRTFRIDGIK